MFFVGDACHTHSPRGESICQQLTLLQDTYMLIIAGLGLNTALLEAQNLAWKLGLVLHGVAKSEVLATYAGERHSVAKELVDMDRQLVTIYADLERQNVDDFESEETAAWLKKLQMFQAKNYAVCSFLSPKFNRNQIDFYALFCVVPSGSIHCVSSK